MLPYADLDRDRVSGLWERRKDGIGCHGTSGYPRLMLPVMVQGDYDLEVEFTRNSGERRDRDSRSRGRREYRRIVPFGQQRRGAWTATGSTGATCWIPAIQPSSRPGELTNGKRYTVCDSRPHAGRAGDGRRGSRRQIVDPLYGGAIGISLLTRIQAPPNRIGPAWEWRRESMPPFIVPACACQAAKEPSRVRGGPNPVPSANGSICSARIDLRRDRVSGDFHRDGR